MGKAGKQEKLMLWDEELGKMVDARRLGVPPADSELWPEYCRGEYWEWRIASFFVGRCQLCAYSCRPPERRRKLDRMANLPTYLLCTNHPDSPGKLRDVLPWERCRNWKLKRWLAPRAKYEVETKPLREYELSGEIRRIPLGHELYAMVDAADYEEVSKYKWCASKKSGQVYAMRRTKDGRAVYMHREIMNAAKGEVVDHIDHNTLNNRRCNLRLLKPEQNYANAGPRGGSCKYVGVYRRDKTWEAGITWRGEHFYLGRYADPVEAARVRDRKAYELHGSLAYLNFPDDFTR